MTTAAQAIGYLLLALVTGVAWVASGAGVKFKLPSLSLPTLGRGKPPKSAVDQIAALKQVIAKAQADISGIVAEQEFVAKASAEASKAAKEAAQ